MLTRLSVRNFALIDEVDLRLHSGLTVLTGETGAGKSILFSAVELLLGERASTDLIRRDADEASVQAVIVPPELQSESIGELLAEAGIPYEGEVIVRRLLSRNGRNRAWINDHIVTTSLLSQVVPRCIDILGQHQHLTLLDPEAQERMIDRAGGDVSCRQELVEAYQRWSETRKRVRKLEAAADERVERMEYIRFQLRELSSLDLEAGEFDELDEKIKRLKYAERLRRAAETVSALLIDGDRAAAPSLGEAREQLHTISAFDDRTDAWCERLLEAEGLIQDVARESAELIEEAPDVDEIDEMVARHEQLRKAMKRFSTDEDGLIQRLDEMSRELEELTHYEDSMASARRQLEQHRAVAERFADELREHRSESARALFDDVQAVLVELGMEHATLSWEPTGEEPKLRRTGWSGYGIAFTANPGEPARPIAKVASGGELSRLLLAVKSVLLERDPVETYLFDEIDTGIGGQAAVVVGEKLRVIGEQRQVLCITHLPQIAGRAHHQLFVSKVVADGRTRTTIEQLDTEQREAEIARMLAGAEVGEGTRAHARELLKIA